MTVKGKTKGNLSYSDPAANLSFSTNKLSNLVISGNHVTFSGTAKIGRRQTISFTVNLTDNGTPGTADTFSINVTGAASYSAGGTLTSGNIQLH